jgi:TRAP-type C4-dicarboxylate transport system permease small subunit
MKKSYFDRFEEYVLVGGLAVLVFLVFLQVVMRFCFRMSLTWSEEIARFLFLWLVWLGAAYAAKRQAHLKIEAFIQKLSSKNRENIDIVALLIWIAFSAFLVWKGGELAMMLFRRRQLSPVLEIRMAWAYAAVPVGAGLMLLRLLGQLRRTLREKTSRASAEVSK